MKLNAISQLRPTGLTNKKVENTRFTNSMATDSVSFGKKGKYEKEKSSSNGFFKQALTFIMGASTAIAVGNKTTNPQNIILSANAAQVEETTAPTLVSLSATQETTAQTTASNSKADIEFQLNQTKDSPSLTFDFTDNYRARVIEPIGTSVVLTSKPQKGSIDEFKNLNDVITNVYEVKTQDGEIRRTIAQSVLKANPEMVEVIGSSLGDVTNIDLDTILNTNYTKSGNLRISLPTVTLTEERRNDYDTNLQISTEFLPKNADENGEAVITLDSKTFNAWSQEANDKILGKKLASAYGIPTFNSYAGDAIWHGIALDEANYEIFEGASEEKTKTAFYNYIKENGTIELTLPRVGVTVMTSEAQDIADDILTQEKNLDVTISYMSPTMPVFDLAGKTTFKPIDVLDVIPFTDGTTIKEAYEENSDKYVSLALSNWQQEVDNNNVLIEHYGTTPLKEEDLYKEIDLKKLGATDMKINLQPVAIAHPDCPIACAPTKPGRPPQETQPAETDPTTKPTETDPTTKPTETDPTTEPTETEPTTEPTNCATEPTTDDDDNEIDITRPTKPTQSTEPTTEPTNCATEPTTDDDDNEIDITRPTKPSQETEATQPTQCPTEPSQPNSNNGNNGTNDNWGDFEDIPTPTQSTPFETQAPPAPTQAPPVETQAPPTEAKPCPTEAPQPTSASNNSGTNDNWGSFEDEPASAKVETPKSTPTPTKTSAPEVVVTQAPAQQEVHYKQESDVNDLIMDFE